MDEARGGTSKPDNGTAERSGPPAGWYKDPEDPAQLRWWDGFKWTEHRQDPRPGEDTSSGSSATQSAPTDRVATQSKRRDTGGFWPFDQPASRDWLFWWAVVLWVLTSVAVTARSSYPISEAVLLDIAMGLVVNTLVFVLVPGWIRRGYRSSDNAGFKPANRSELPSSSQEQQWVRGWYPDPHHDGWERYWNGSNWTSRVRQVQQ